MKEPRVSAFDHREFWVAVVKSGNGFKAAGYEALRGSGPRKVVAVAEGSTQGSFRGQVFLFSEIISGLIMLKRKT